MRLRVPKQARLNTPMTAMIDVVFLLLVFFVWTSSFQEEELLLPSSVASAEGIGDTAVELDLPVEVEPMVVRIRWSADRPEWIVNGGAIDQFDQVQALMAEVADVGADVPLIVDPDGDVPLGQAVRVYDAARAASFTRVHFAVSPE